MKRASAALLTICLLAARTFAGTPESPNLLPEDFCNRLVKLVELAPSGFYEIRGDRQNTSRLPNSTDWTSELTFTGATGSLISDVPDMGNYNFRTVWEEGANMEQAIRRKQQLVDHVHECLATQGWSVTEREMPSSSSSESVLFLISDPENPALQNINVLISVSEKGEYEVSLKVTYSI